VIVCTEATANYDITRRLLLAGKHVLVEKPLTTRSTDAEELIELSESRFATLMVGHTFVFNAGIRKVKEYVKDQNGRVYYLYARRTNLGRTQLQSKLARISADSLPNLAGSAVTDQCGEPRPPSQMTSPDIVDRPAGA